MYKLSTKFAKDFQGFRVLNLDWLETIILYQLDVSRLDDPQPALVLIVLFSLYVCVLAFLDHLLISQCDNKFCSRIFKTQLF